MKNTFTLVAVCFVSLNGMAQHTQQPDLFAKLEKVQACNQRSLHQPMQKTTGTGSRLKSYLQKKYNGATFMDSDSLLLNYTGSHGGDLQNPPLKYDNYVAVTMSGGNWVNNYKSLQTFDAQDNIATQISQNWNSVTNAWDNSYKYTYSYDANNNMIGELTQTWNSGVWDNLYRYTNTYSGGLLTQQVSENWDNVTSSWKFSGKHTYQYNSGNQRTMDIYQIWNTVTSSWENQWRDVFNYNSSGDNDETVTQTWNTVTSAWQNDYKSVMSYNSNHKVTQIVNMDWNTVSSAYVNQYQNVYTYNSNDQVASLETKTWNTGGFWEYTTSDSHYDVRYETYLGVNDVAVNGSLSLYPVPATDRLTMQLNWNSNRPFVVSIMDVLGKELQQWNEAGSMQYSKTIDVQTLAPGTYFLKVANHEGKAAKGFTVIR